MTETHRTCSKCKKILPVDEFNFRYREKGIRLTYCRECGKLLTRNHYKNNKKQYLKRNARSLAKRQEFVRNFKSRPCQDCGIQYPYYVMDFDHREDEIKEHQLNQVARQKIKTIESEIAKCDVVCSNCHRERTFQRLKRKGFGVLPKVTTSIPFNLKTSVASRPIVPAPNTAARFGFQTFKRLCVSNACVIPFCTTVIGSSKTPNAHAEIINAPKPRASIRYSCQCRRNEFNISTAV